MVLYKQIRKNWNSDESVALQKQRLIVWRQEPATVRIDHPTRLDRARSLGYRAKQGILVVRQRVLRGSHERPRDWGGRRTKNTSMRLDLGMNYQAIAERRANDIFHNCEVLNSYEAGADGRHLWYEIILIDPQNPSITSDPILSAVAKSPRARAYRGLTAASRRSRGLLNRGTGAEKLRPSKTASWKKRSKEYLRKMAGRYVR
jgi:large subunit ribosomal protein L15e